MSSRYAYPDHDGRNYEEKPEDEPQISVLRGGGDDCEKAEICSHDFGWYIGANRVEGLPDFSGGPCRRYSWLRRRRRSHTAAIKSSWLLRALGVRARMAISLVLRNRIDAHNCASECGEESLEHLCPGNVAAHVQVVIVR